MEQPTKTSTPVSHRAISRFDSMRLAETLTRNDLIDASTAELYAAVMEPPGVRLVVASPDSPNLNRERKELCNVALFC